MRRPMVTSICSCMTSFVVLVMREAVEKLSSSLPEKPSTRSKTAWRRSRAKPEPTLDDMRPTRTVAAAPSRVRRSMVPPTPAM